MAKEDIGRYHRELTGDAPDNLDFIQFFPFIPP